MDVHYVQIWTLILETVFLDKPQHLSDVCCKTWTLQIQDFTSDQLYNKVFQLFCPPASHQVRDLDLSPLLAPY